MAAQTASQTAPPKVVQWDNTTVVPWVYQKAAYLVAPKERYWEHLMATQTADR